MTTLHHHVHGPADGPPVLALHGVTGHAGRWDVLAAALPHLRLIAVDLRGHGRSPWAPPWGLEQHVSDALGVLDALELPRVAIIGHSFGGAIALHLARVAPERVERLVLLDPALGLDAQDMLETADETCTAESYPDRAAARADRARRWEGLAGDIVDAELDHHLERGDDGRYRYRYSTPAVVTAWGEMARTAVLAPPGLRTLLIPAAKADFVDPVWVARMATELGDALTVREIDAGHMVYLERTAEVADVIHRFLTA